MLCYNARRFTCTDCGELVDSKDATDGHPGLCQDCVDLVTGVRFICSECQELTDAEDSVDGRPGVCQSCVDAENACDGRAVSVRTREEPVNPTLPPDSRPVIDPNDPRSLIPGHAVRDNGTVFYYSERWRKWVPLKTKTGPGGFVKVRLMVKGKEREIGVARLVLRAFVGPQPLGFEPLHFPNVDPADNRLCNLRWAPIGSSKVGRMLSGSPPPPPRGDNHHNARLTAADVPEIRRMYRDGFMYKEIAIEFDVSEETIRHVLIGETWSHVPDPDGPIVMRRHGPGSDSASNTKLDWGSVRAIRAGHAAGRSYRKLGAEFGVDRCTIRDIIKGRTWRES
jgi:hypothetical protein